MNRARLVTVALIFAVACSPTGKSDLERFRDSITHVQSSIALEPSGSPFVSVSEERMAEIAERRRYALAEAEAIDPNELACLHEDMPTHFMGEYLPGLSLWLEGYDNDDVSQMNEARLLTNAWGNWYRGARTEVLGRKRTQEDTPSLLAFLIKALVFDFVYSFAVGVVVAIVMLPLVALSKSEEPGPLAYIFGIPAGMALCAVQGAVMAAAVVAALQIEPNRWSALWYLVGFCLSLPIAMVRSVNDPYQRRWFALGVIASSGSYVLACIWPEYIPALLGNTATRVLL